MSSEDEVAAAAMEVEKMNITPSGHVKSEEEPKLVMPKVDWAKYSKRVVIKKIVGRPDGGLGLGLAGERVVVGGWVKTAVEKSRPSFAFFEINDPNCPASVQARVPQCLRSLMRMVTGANNNNGDGNTPGGAPQPTVAPPNSIGSMKAQPTPGRSLSAEAYLQISDGSCSTNLQVVVDSSIASLKELTPTGTSIVVEGVLSAIPEGTRKKVQLKAQKILQVGAVDPAKYPLTKTRLPLDFLRNYVHLRPRTNTISSVARIRNALAYATHTFFQNHGFLYVHTPLITTTPSHDPSADTFQVTTLFTEADRLERELRALNNPTQPDLDAAKASVTQNTQTLDDLRRYNADQAAIDAVVEDLNRAKNLLSKMEEIFKRKGAIALKDGKFDHSADFFSRQAYLTVSGQLHVESFACALSSVYTFGPTFQAHNINSKTHLAEYWKVEPEMAFADLEDAMNCAEDLLKFLCQWLLDNCADDIKFMQNNFDKAIFDRLRIVASTPFARLTYTEALDLLKEVPRFENKLQWGMDLTREHERCLTEEILKKAVIVYNHPKEVKPFYMRVNENGRTVASMDVLVPKVGGFISGSQREERYEILEKRIQELRLPREPYEWYLDLRRYGSVKHSGFGLGFEWMVFFSTGLENIKDCIPFPRHQGRADT